MFEKRKQGGPRRWLMAGGTAVAFALSSPLVSACEGGWPGTAAADAGSQLPGDEHLSVDCAAQPDATATKQIVVGKYVQILMLKVTGKDYNDAWRVQLFPGESDLSVSAPEGKPPQLRVPPDLLSGKEPSAVALGHGSVSVHRTDAPQAAETPAPDASQSAPPPYARPSQQYNFAFVLSCEAAPGAQPLQP